MNNEAAWLKKTFSKCNCHNIFFKSFYVVNSRRFWFYEDIPKKDVDKAICYSYIKIFNKHISDGYFIVQSPVNSYLYYRNTNYIMWFQSLFHDIKEVYLSLNDLDKHSLLCKSIFTQILLASSRGNFILQGPFIIAKPYTEDILAIERDMTLNE